MVSGLSGVWFSLFLQRILMSRLHPAILRPSTGQSSESLPWSSLAFPGLPWPAWPAGLPWLLGLIGCETSESTEGAQPMAADAAVPPRMALPMPEPGVWETIYPGGDTICSRGDEYRFYLRGGDPRKLMIYFQGGGACWNELTCSVADSIFSDRVNEPVGFFFFLVALLLDALLLACPPSDKTRTSEQARRFAPALQRT